jgi:uncharacterized protein (TIGR00304 family)
LDATFAYAVGLALVVAGIVIIALALILASIRGTGKGKADVKSAGVIMIGPIPIIFGTDKKSIEAVLVLALVLTITLIIASIVYYWLLR